MVRGGFCRVTIFFGNSPKGLTALYIVCTSIKLNLSHKTLIYRRKKYVKVYTFIYVCRCQSIEGPKTIFFLYVCDDRICGYKLLNYLPLNDFIRLFDLIL